MNGKDIVNLPNSKAELAFDRDGDGNLRLTIIDLLGKAEAEATTPKRAKVASEAKEAVEKAEADPTDAKAQQAAKDKMALAEREGFITKADFDKYVLENSKRFEDLDSRVSALESFEKSVREVLPKDEKGNLLVIETHIREFVAEFRGIDSKSLRFSLVRFLVAFVAAWIVLGVLIALIFGWGTFNAVVLGLLAGGIIGFGFGFQNKRNDNH